MTSTKKTDEARNARRTLIAEARAYLYRPSDLNRQASALVMLSNGKEMVARHIDEFDGMVHIISSMSNSRFDRTIVHIDDVTAIKLVDDGIGRTIQPSDVEAALIRFAEKMVKEEVCKGPAADDRLKSLYAQEGGMACFEAAAEAAEAAGHFDLIDRVAELIGKNATLGDLEADDQALIHNVFAMAAAKAALEQTYEPYGLEREWIARASAVCAANCGEVVKA